MQRAEQPKPEDAIEAVKAYLRLYRNRLAADPELLALLLPLRFADAPDVSDFQHFVIGRMAAEIAALKADRTTRRGSSEYGEATYDGVKRLVLDLLNARGFDEAVKIACGAAPLLCADVVSLGIESNAHLNLGRSGMHLLAPGAVQRLLAADAVGAVLKGNAYTALFPGAGLLQSVAVFRMNFGDASPPALYAVGSHDPDRFDDDGETREIAYFVRAMETTIRAWLQPLRS
ncbi:MAG: hypothetical protein RJB62_899 [Pseudomonadota bacterium]|jgi:uncharacterized protein YigA (DUF484 family)